MAKPSRKAAEIEKINDSEWLFRLLADAREGLANEPTPEAIERIRSTLQAEMDRPDELAA